MIHHSFEQKTIADCKMYTISVLIVLSPFLLHVNEKKYWVLILLLLEAPLIYKSRVTHSKVIGIWISVIKYLMLCIIVAPLRLSLNNGQKTTCFGRTPSSADLLETCWAETHPVILPVGRIINLSLFGWGLLFHSVPVSTCHRAHETLDKTLLLSHWRFLYQWWKSHSCYRQ